MPSIEKARSESDQYAGDEQLGCCHRRLSLLFVIFTATSVQQDSKLSYVHYYFLLSSIIVIVFAAVVIKTNPLVDESNNRRLATHDHNDN